MLFNSFVISLLKVEDLIKPFSMAFFLLFDIFTILDKLIQPLDSLAMLGIFPITINTTSYKRNTFEFLFFQVIFLPYFPICTGTNSFRLEGALFHLFVLFVCLYFLWLFFRFLFCSHKKFFFLHPCHALALRVNLWLES